ncbi:hypothetical protein ACUNWD_14735 [Sunxiuqinia sp. A32]|uniref:hypothetical protein n=1 Tax=Sunxiuqinia sp. A32 TaxID=3461496 RepID=UPI0040467A2D
MKINFIILFITCATLNLSAQKLDWYSYWGSSSAGSQIEPVRMVVDGDGYIYLSALFGGTEVNVLGNTVESLSSTDKGDALIVKMSSDKAEIWKHVLAGTSNSIVSISEIVVDNDNNLIVTGTFTGVLRGDDSNSIVMEDPSGFSEKAMFVIRYDPQGNVLNMWQVPSEEIAVGGLAVDKDNNVVVSGSFNSEMSFDPNDLNTMIGSIDYNLQFFVVKYSSEGELIWSKYTNSEDVSFSNAFVKTDTAANIYIGGTFTGEFTFAGSTLTTAAGVDDLFLVKYLADGTESWSKRIGGTRNDKAAAVEVSNYGDVAISASYYSEDITVSGTSYILQNGFASTGDATQYHLGVFTFNQNSGNYRWWYSFGRGSTVNGGGGAAAYLRCSDEGVWYVGGQTSNRFGDLYTYENFGGNDRYGMRLFDGTWVQHNTNGGADAIFLVLNREGKPCSIARPGGVQTEEMQDVALSPDKKSVYMLFNINVRDNEIFTCVDNLWDSYTDIKIYGRKAMYTLLQVYCPETPVDSKYSNLYKGVFASTIIAKYTFPELTPSELPAYETNETYVQELSITSPEGTQSFYQMMVPEEMNFINNALSGTITQGGVYYFGVMAIDSTELPGKITYYAQDPNLESIRGNSRNVRYMKLSNEAEEGIQTAMNSITTINNVVFYPTVCSDYLNIKTDESNYFVRIYSQAGVLVGIYQNVTRVPVNNFQRGLYFVLLQLPTGDFSQAKIIVE